MIVAILTGVVVWMVASTIIGGGCAIVADVMQQKMKDDANDKK